MHRPTRHAAMSPLSSSFVAQCGMRIAAPTPGQGKLAPPTAPSLPHRASGTVARLPQKSLFYRNTPPFRSVAFCYPSRTFPALSSPGDERASHLRLGYHRKPPPCKGAPAPMQRNTPPSATDALSLPHLPSSFATGPLEEPPLRQYPPGNRPSPQASLLCGPSSSQGPCCVGHTGKGHSAKSQAFRQRGHASVTR